MHLFKILIIFIIFFSGCSVKQQEKKSIKPIKPFEEKKTPPPPPPIVFESPYKPISPLDNKFITLSAKDAPLSYFLYSIAKTANLNLVIGKDVNINQKITLNLNQAPLKEALDIIMDITGYFYEIKGNILYIRQYMTKIFKIPYIHTTSSYSSNLGGDVLGANNAQNGNSATTDNVKGEFSLQFSNPKEANNFYNQLEKNLKLLISKNGKFTLNKFTGILIVTDKKENIKKIEKFLKKITKATSKGVLIEAKILEVILNKNHQLGINWNKVFNSIDNGKLTLTQTLGLSNAVAGSIQYTKQNFNMLIQAIESNGKVQTLSNPRIRVLNGQSAIILSGDIYPFWEKSVNYTTVTTGNNSTVVPEVSYSRRDVLEGISLGVTPIIKDDDTIILNIVPVSTSIEDVVTFTQNNQIVAMAPKLNIKEAGTVIKAKDNDLIIIGGLINEKKTKRVVKVPILGDIPIIKNLFRRVENAKSKRELVILLRLRVIDNE
jgi:MSHA biogenesis protein MshL